MNLLKPKLVYKKVQLFFKSKYLNLTLYIVAFTESFIFPIPPDVFLIPACYNNKAKAFRYALFTTIFSVLGGIVGYYIGYFLYNIFIYDLLVKFNYLGKFNEFKALYTNYGFWAVFIAGFTPIPYKIATIASGVLSINILLFVAASLLSRGLRFTLVAALSIALKNTSLKKLKNNINSVIIIFSIIIVILIAILIYFVK